MKKIYSILFLMVVGSVFIGCDSGGGIVGDYIDNSDSGTTTTTIETNTTQSVTETTTIISNNYRIDSVNESNVTSVYAIKLNNDKLASMTEKSVLNSVLYIELEEKLKHSLYISNKNIQYKTLRSNSNLIYDIANAQNTHFNSIVDMKTEYKISSTDYKNNGLLEFYKDVNKTIVLNEIDSLKLFSKLEEKTIADLNYQISVIPDGDFKDLYSAIRDASKSHLKLLVNFIYENGSTYSAQILTSQEYIDIIGSELGATTVSNIKVYNQYDEDNITQTLATKINLNNLTLSNIKDKESLLYIAYEEKIISEVFNLYKTSILKNLRAVSSDLTKISEAEDTRYKATGDILNFYNLYEDFNTLYKNSGLDNFKTLITNKNPTTSKDIIASLLLTQERSIVDLTNQLTDIVNQDIIDLYTNLLIGSKNHLNYLSQLYYNETKSFYISQILKGDEYNQYVNVIIPVNIVIPVYTPKLNIYSYFGDYNTTSISLLELDTSLKPYKLNIDDNTSLKYLSALVKGSKDSFDTLVTLINNSSYLTSSPLLIKEKFNNLKLAETSHDNIMIKLDSIYGVTSSTYSELNDFYNSKVGEYLSASSQTPAIVPEITNEDQLIDMLTNAANIQERKICDINKIGAIVNNDLNNSYARVKQASINHLNIIVDIIKDAQGSYSLSLLNTQNCGAGVDNLLLDTNGSKDENIDVELYVDANGISQLIVAEKPIGGELPEATLKEQESLKFMMELTQLSQKLTQYVYGSGTNLSILNDIALAKNTHVSSMSNLLGIYGVNTPVETGNNTLLNEFEVLINGKDISDTNSTLVTAALIEERNILAFEDHIVNEVNLNQDMVLVYTEFLKASTNHIKIINAKMVEFGMPVYTFQLLDPTYVNFANLLALPYIEGTNP